MPKPSRINRIVLARTQSQTSTLILLEKYSDNRAEGCDMINVMKLPRSPSLRALLELGLLFLPAIPAYLFLWPNVSGTAQTITQIIVYFYILAGTLWIGLRRWTWDQLGVNRRGIELSLICGLFITVGRILVVISVDWGTTPPVFNLLHFLGAILFYFGLVGIVEELLFRGLVYRLLEDRLGLRWAIWGSSLAFAFWHVPGQGLLAGLGTFFLGLIFALIRWRGGGIVGLIIVHGLIDITVLQLVPEVSSAVYDQIALPHPFVAYCGFFMILAVPVYLWKIYPRFHRATR
jgi:membrane protease YdiL (CAAX protease family)